MKRNSHFCVFSVYLRSATLILPVDDPMINYNGTLFTAQQLTVFLCFNYHSQSLLGHHQQRETDQLFLLVQKATQRITSALTPHYLQQKLWLRWSKGPKRERMSASSSWRFTLRFVEWLFHFLMIRLLQKHSESFILLIKPLSFHDISWIKSTK